jgi:cholesterol transport system auxiliary component
MCGVQGLAFAATPDVTWTLMSAVLCLALSSCALTSNAPPLDIRYFSPVAGASAPVSTTHADRTPLRLGRITPSAHLRYRIVYRSSAVEVALYEAFRWTDRPDAYVRRALEHELFEVRPLDRMLGGPAPTLDVEVTAFEEVRRGTRRAGRVELRYELEDSSSVIATGVVSVERPAADARIESVVAAIGDALSAASSQLANTVAAKLERRAPTREEEPRSPT